MSINKMLNEMSKPVAWLVKGAQGQYVELNNDNDGVGIPLYPQGYVSILLAALEDARKGVTYFCNLNAQKNERIAELEARIAQPVKIPHPDLFDDDEVPDVVISVTSARLRAQGFSVEREAFKC